MRAKKGERKRKRFDADTVFISHSHDTDIFAKVARDAVLEIVKQYGWDVFRHGEMPASLFDTFAGFQSHIPSPLDPRCRATIVLLGERVGQPIGGQASPPEGIRNMIAGSGWPIEAASPTSTSKKIPLTGTVFELLEAYTAWKQDERPVWVFLNAPEKALPTGEYAGTAALDRNFGYGRLSRELIRLANVAEASDEADRTRIAVQRDYPRQVQWLETLLRALDKSHAKIICFKDEDELRNKIIRLAPMFRPVRPKDPEAPFKLGGVAYDESLNDCFYGRDSEIRERLLQLENADHRWMILYGRSGVGKSSLARAGMAGRLLKQGLASDARTSANNRKPDVRLLHLVVDDLRGAHPARDLAAKVLVALEIDDAPQFPKIPLLTRLDLPERKPLWANVRAWAQAVAKLADERKRRLLIILDDFEKAADKKVSCHPIYVLLDELTRAIPPQQSGSKKWRGPVLCVCCVREELRSGSEMQRQGAKSILESAFKEVGSQPSWERVSPPTERQVAEVLDRAFGANDLQLPANARTRLLEDFKNGTSGTDEVSVLLPLLSMHIQRIWLEYNKALSTESERRREATSNEADLTSGENDDLTRGGDYPFLRAVALEKALEAAGHLDNTVTLQAEAAVSSLPESQREPALTWLFERVMHWKEDGSRWWLQPVGMPTQGTPEHALVAALTKARLLKYVPVHSFEIAHRSLATLWRRARDRIMTRERLLATHFWFQEDFLRESSPSPSDNERALSLLRLRAARASTTGDKRYWRDYDNWLVMRVKNEDDPAARAQLLGAIVEADAPELVQECLNSVIEPTAIPSHGLPSVSSSAVVMGLVEHGQSNLAHLAIGKGWPRFDEPIRAEARNILHSIASDRATAAAQSVALAERKKDAAEFVDSVLKRIGGETRIALVTAVNPASDVPSLAGREGWSPLHEAAAEGRDDLIGVMLNAATFPSIKDILLGLDEPRQNDHGGIDLAPLTRRFRGAPTPLHLAAERGHALTVKKLLRYYGKFAPFSKRAGDGDTPLLTAIRHGHAHVAEILLNAQASPALKHRGTTATTNSHLFERDFRGLTVFHLAARNADDQSTNILIQALERNWARKKVPEFFKDGRLSPLHIAAEMNATTVVQRWLDAGVSPVIKDKFGQTPLHIAARANAVEVARLLSKTTHRKKSIVNVEDLAGRTPLHAAVALGRRNMVPVLLEAQVYPNRPDKQGQTPLVLAARFGDRDIAELLLQIPQVRQAMNATPGIENLTDITAAFRPKTTPGVVSDELSDGEESNDLRWLGPLPPLHHAAVFNRTSFVRWFLAQEAADPLAATPEGATALHLAAAAGNIAVVRLFADTDAGTITNDYGRTALHYAARRGTEEVVRELLRWRKISVDARNLEGQTALHLAAYSGSRRSVELLLQRASDAHLEVADAKGRTPLWSAAQAGGAGRVEALLARRANPNHVAARLRSVLHAGAMSGNGAVVSQLLAAGADPVARDDFGRTAMHVACAAAAADAAIAFLEALKDDGARIAAISAQDGLGRTPLSALMRHLKPLAKKPPSFEEGLAGSLIGATRAQTIRCEDLSGATVGCSPRESGQSTSPPASEDVCHALDARRVIAHMRPLLRHVEPTLRAQSFGLAALYGDAETLSLLVEPGPLNAPVIGLNASCDVHGRAPLHLAARSGSVSALEVLLAAGADRLARAADDTTPLHHAALHGSVAAAERLLTAQSAEQSAARDLFDQTPLHAAVKAARGDLEAAHAIAVRLISAGADLNARNMEGETPLHVAAYEGAASLASMLLAHGAGAQWRDQRGQAPLMTAVNAANYETAAVLLDATAAVDATVVAQACATARIIAEQIGRTPAPQDDDRQDLLANLAALSELGQTQRKGLRGRADYSGLWRHKRSHDPLWLAASNRDWVFVEDRLQRIAKRDGGIDPTRRSIDGLGRSLLARFVADVFDSREELTDIPERIRRLCDLGADLGARDKMDATVIHHAAFASRLVELGEVPTRGGKNRIKLIAPRAIGAPTRALLEAGARVETGDKMGRRPLHYAADAGNVEAATLLFVAMDLSDPVRVQRDLRDRFGFTPLHLACWRGHVEMTEFLATKLPPEVLDWKSSNGQSALILAAFNARADNADAWIGCAALLLSAGASPNLEDPYGRIAAAIAGSERWAAIEAQAAASAPQRSPNAPDIRFAVNAEDSEDTENAIGKPANGVDDDASLEERPGLDVVAPTNPATESGCDVFVESPADASEVPSHRPSVWKRLFGQRE